MAINFDQTLLSCQDKREMPQKKEWKKPELAALDVDQTEKPSGGNETTDNKTLGGS